MSTVYHRVSHSAESQPATVDHVIATLSSMVSPTDDPDEFANEVHVTFSKTENGDTRIYGEIDRDPPPYELPEDYVEPARNRQQRGFGERIMSDSELEQHLITKGINL